MIEYSEETTLALLCLPFQRDGSVAIKALGLMWPSMALAVALSLAESYVDGGVLERLGVANFQQLSVLWAASGGVLAILLGFRTNRAMARFWEGTGLLHQMRGEWFDSVSCCVTFSREASVYKGKPQQVREFRHTIVRLMSLCHGSALEEISGIGEDAHLETIDTLGLDDKTLRHLKECRYEHKFNRVEVLLHLIQSLITDAQISGVLAVAPPILSRVYQTLSRGFVNLLNAKKIADTRFPFPYAQTISTLLYANLVLTPVLVVSLVQHPVWSALFAGVPLFGAFSMNFIGMELENPFGDDDNDLPLQHFQDEMNKCLMMLLQENADLVPSISRARCKTNYPDLLALMQGSESADAGDGSRASRSQNFEHFLYPSESSAGSDGNDYRSSNGEEPPKPDIIVEESQDTVPATPSTLASQGLALATAAVLASQGPAMASEGLVPRTPGRGTTFQPPLSPTWYPPEPLPVPPKGGTTLARVDAAYNSLRAILEEAVIVDLRQTLESLSLLGDSISVLLAALRADHGGGQDLDLLASSRGPGALTCSPSPRLGRLRLQTQQPSQSSGDMIDDVHLASQEFLLHLSGPTSSEVC